MGVRERRLVARQGVDVAHRRLDTLCIAGGGRYRGRCLGGAPNLRGDRPAVFESIKLQAIPPSLEHHFPLAQLVYHSSASLFLPLCR
jgi:hypothetical protein